MTKTLIKLDTVFHVGLLDYNKKNRFSYEGDTLSVSQCPKTWSSLARTQGKNNLLYKENASYVDYYQFIRENKLHIINHGLEYNQIIEKDVFSYSYFDDEMDTEVTIEALSKEDIFEEHSMIDDSDLNYERKFVLSNHGMDFFPYSKFDRLDITPVVLDYIKQEFSEDKNIVGVWWNDIFDPSRYSAPRGAIFNHKLPEFEINQIDDLVDYIGESYDIELNSGSVIQP